MSPSGSIILSLSPTYFYSSYSLISLSSYSTTAHPPYFPSYCMSVFIRSHLHSEGLLNLLRKSKLIYRYAMCSKVCMCPCVTVRILCILDCKSKFLCQTVGGVLWVCWQITSGSAVMCLLDTLANRQKIGLNFCLAPLLFCCVKADPAALIASDTDNKT